jgi:phosphoribosylformylglycinamidine synthase
MVGVIEGIERHCSSAFKSVGDLIILLDECRNELGGSEYLRVIHKLARGDVPTLDLRLERAVQDTCFAAIQAGLVSSAHDCSEGGLVVTLAECCISDQERQIGAEVWFPRVRSIRTDALLFGESQSRILISCHPKDLGRVETIARKRRIPFQVLGKVGGGRLVFTLEEEKLINIPIHTLAETWEDGLLSRVSGRKAISEG